MLARTLYPSPTLRPYSDIDLTVPEASVAAAATVLRAAGFRRCVYEAEGRPRGARRARPRGGVLPPQVRRAAAAAGWWSCTAIPSSSASGRPTRPGAGAGPSPVPGPRWGTDAGLGRPGRPVERPRPQARLRAPDLAQGPRPPAADVRGQPQLGAGRDRGPRRRGHRIRLVRLELASRLLGAPLPAEVRRRFRPTLPLRAAYRLAWPVARIADLDGSMRRRAVQFHAAESWRGMLPSLLYMGRRGVQPRAPSSRLSRGGRRGCRLAAVRTPAPAPV